MRRISPAFLKSFLPKPERIWSIFRKYWFIPCLVLVGFGVFLATHRVDAQVVPPPPPPATSVTPTQSTPPPSSTAAPAPGQGESAPSCTGAWSCIQAAVVWAISKILGIIVSFLGWLIMLLVDVLIVFAQYNKFGEATVVITGWVIIRDIVNMFFIVVILISAFSTIIGYDSSFHYTKVLPKLLLMAILINFSRTLILLLVDFSQIVMLTFVNAFRQSAAGNFVQVLGLDSYLRVSENASDPNVISVITAYMLAIVFCVITVGVLSVMLAYLIARIVGLWIAIMVSPMAFFATALPGRLQKAVSSFTQGYWEKLTALLTGGPVMAFFLWLTLATTQAANSTGGIANTLGFSSENAGGVAGFISSIGNSQAIATFIVGIALLLVGLQAAVTVAGQVSSALGQVAGSIASTTKSIAGGMAKAPFRAGAWGAKQGGKWVNQKANITGFAGGVIAKTAGRIPVVRGLVRPTQQKLMGMQREQNETDAKKMLEGFDKLSPEQQQRAYGTIPRGATATKGDLDAAGRMRQIMGGEVAQKRDTKALKKKYKEEMMAARGVAAGDPAEADIDREANSRAMEEVQAKSAPLLAEARDLLSRAGNTDEVAKIDAMYEKNPMLMNPGREREAMMKKISGDGALIDNLDASAISDGHVLQGVIGGDSTIKRDAAGNVTAVDMTRVKQFLEDHKGKQVAKNVEAFVKHINDSIATGINVSQLDNSMIQRSPTGDPEMYERPAAGGNYVRKLSGKEDKAVTDLNREFGGTTKGRSGTGLSTSAAAALHDSTRNISLPKALRLADDQSDGRASQSVGAMVQKNMEDMVLPATSAADAQRMMRESYEVVAQVGKAGMSTQARVNILLGALKGGMADRVKDKKAYAQLPAEFKKAALQVHETLFEVAEELKKKAAPSAEESDLISRAETFRFEIASMPKDQVVEPIRRAAGVI